MPRYINIDGYRKQQAEIERLECEIGKLLPKGCSYAVQMEVSNNLETKIRAEAAKEIFEDIEQLFIDGCEIYYTMDPEEYYKLKNKYICGAKLD